MPEFRKAIVSFGGKVAMRDTLQEALRAVSSATRRPRSNSRAPAVGADHAAAHGDGAQLLDRALAAYDAAQAALKAGDLAEYQRRINEFYSLTKQARDESAKTSTTPTTAASRSA